MKIFDNFKENLELMRENSKMRISKKEIEEAFSDLQQKYINLLEWKSNQFDLYLTYQEQCESLVKDKKDLKRQLAEGNEEILSLTDKNHELCLQIEKLEKKIKKLNQKSEKSA